METSPAAQAAPGPALDEANLGKLGRFIVSRWFGVCAALLSLLAISVYVFGYTPYLEYLYSDMKAYWDRAMFRLNNNHFSDSQFIAWPPLYHIFLAEFFRVFRWLGLEDWIQLKAALAINISVFAVSVFALQRLAANWFRRPSYVLICVLLYGLGFPALYFNAFLLSGNLGGPLFVIALAVASGRFSWSSLIIAALTFGLATIIRPSLGPYGLAFVLLYACRYGLWNKAFIARAAVFTILFFSVVFAASTEVSRISQGRVNGLSANGGLDFFIANTDYHRVDLTYDGWHFFVVVPSMSWKPEQGIFHTTVPFYEQDYYFDLGVQAIKRNPASLLSNFAYVRNLFFADMLPTRFDAPGFAWLRPSWDWMKFGMFVCLGLYFWGRREIAAEDATRAIPQQLPTFTSLAAVLGITMVVAFIFTGEPRYTYEIIPVFYLLFFKLVELFWRAPRVWLKRIAIYALILSLVSAALWVVIESLKPVYPNTVAVSIEAIDAPAPGPVLGADNQPPLALVAGRMTFPFSKDPTGITHAEGGILPIAGPALVRMRARMEVLGDTPLEISIRAYSSWPLVVHVDGGPLSSHSDPKFFVGTDSTIEYAPGFHDIEMTIEYKPYEGGMALNYSYVATDGWRIRRAIGIDSERVRFQVIAPAMTNQNNKDK